MPKAGVRLREDLVRDVEMALREHQASPRVKGLYGIR